jgi:hypothetical protein
MLIMYLNIKCYIHELHISEIRDKNLFRFHANINLRLENMCASRKLYIIPLSPSYLPVSACSLLPFHLTILLVSVTN